jgi:hypothetical protein
VVLVRRLEAASIGLHAYACLADASRSEPT